MTKTRHMIPLSILFFFVLFIGTSNSQEVQENPKQQAEPELELDLDLEEMEFGDEEIQEGQAVLEMGFPGSPSRMKAVKKFQLTQLFTVEADQIATVCGLDKKQALKLKIAVKGAIKKGTDEWLKQYGSQFNGMPEMAMDAEGNADADKKKDSEPEVEIKDADEIDEMLLQMVTMDGMGNPFKMTDPLEGKFWKKTVGGVLNDKQAAVYEKYQVERRKAKLEAMVKSVLSTMKVELALTDDQLSQFEKLVRPPVLNAKINCHAFYEPFLIYYHASKADGEQLKKIFSPAQFQKWKLFVAPAQQIGQMMEMEGEALEAGGDMENPEAVVEADGK